MAKLKEYLVLLALLNVSASDFIQNNGAEITIKVTQEIPKHLCWRFLNNLEVQIAIIVLLSARKLLHQIFFSF